MVKLIAHPKTLSKQGHNLGSIMLLEEGLSRLWYGLMFIGKTGYYYGSV